MSRPAAALLALALAAAGAQAQGEGPAEPAEAGVVAPAAAAAAVAGDAEIRSDTSEPAHAPPADDAAAREIEREVDRGIASWYGPGLHGRRTANGERFDQHALTAAHRSLPFGTVVRVRSLVNGKTVDVRINDRGPFLKRRIIDLSRGAAAALGLLESRRGVKPVAISILDGGAR